MIEAIAETLTDLRQPWKTKHLFHEIVIMTIVAVTAECEHWYQIHHYCKQKG